MSFLSNFDSSTVKWDTLWSIKPEKLTKKPPLHLFTWCQKKMATTMVSWKGEIKDNVDHVGESGTVKI